MLINDLILFLLDKTKSEIDLTKLSLLCKGLFYKRNALERAADNVEISLDDPIFTSNKSVKYLEIIENLCCLYLLVYYSEDANFIRTKVDFGSTIKINSIKSTKSLSKFNSPALTISLLNDSLVPQSCTLFHRLCYRDNSLTIDQQKSNSIFLKNIFKPMLLMGRNLINNGAGGLVDRASFYSANLRTWNVEPSVKNMSMKEFVDHMTMNDKTAREKMLYQKIQCKLDEINQDKNPQRSLQNLIYNIFDRNSARKSTTDDDSDDETKQLILEMNSLQLHSLISPTKIFDDDSKTNEKINFEELVKTEAQLIQLKTMIPDLKDLLSQNKSKNMKKKYMENTRSVLDEVSENFNVANITKALYSFNERSMWVGSGKCDLSKILDENLIESNIKKILDAIASSENLNKARESVGCIDNFDMCLMLIITFAKIELQSLAIQSVLPLLNRSDSAKIEDMNVRLEESRVEIQRLRQQVNEQEESHREEIKELCDSFNKLNKKVKNLKN